MRLKPEDVDLERQVHVRRSLAWVKIPEDEGQWMEREPKRGSVRDLPMTETIHRAWCVVLRRGSPRPHQQDWKIRAISSSVSPARLCTSAM